MTSVPAVAVAFSPVTLLFGPSVAYNVAALLLPTLAAWTAFLLCRYVTRSTWASIVGGYLYGFSSFVLGHQLGGHLNLTATFVIPLAALAVLRYMRGDIGGGGLLWRLSAILAFEAYTSTELSLTLALMAAAAFVLAFAILPASRARLVSALPWVAGSYAIAAVLAAPLGNVE